MPFNGSGGFNRVRNWKADATAKIKIKSDFHDQEDDNLSAGLSSVITKDGQTQPTGNLPLNGKRWVNAGDPVDPQDYATRHWVEVLPGWTTSRYISGADAEGRLNFTSPTGVNGITWAAADVSLLGRIAEDNKTSNRLVINSAVDGSGSDVFIVDDAGRISAPSLSWNLSWDGDEWRTKAPGLASLISFDGNIHFWGLDAATTLDPYKPAPMREFASLIDSAGSALLYLIKSASAKTAYILSRMGTQNRWLMQLGDASAESATRKGSNFILTSYDNPGTTSFTEFSINRETHLALFGGSVQAPTIISTQNFDSVSTVCILSATNGGAIYFRPNGPTSTVEQMILDTAGGLSLSGTGGVHAGAGLLERAGQAGSYGTQYINFVYGTGLHAWVTSSDLGAITFSCDYRIKQDVRPLHSTWEKVKAMRPVSYQFTDYGDLFKADGVERWGFVAHELQETLLPSAANGHKDEENVIQAPDLMAVVAALTSALQEAQVRIEMLEARG